LTELKGDATLEVNDTALPQPESAKGRSATETRLTVGCPKQRPLLAADRASGGTRHRAFRAVRTHARHGPHQLRGDLNRFTFLLGGSDGERLFGP